MSLRGRYIQVSGSADEKTELGKLANTHRVVRATCRAIFRAGGGVIVGINDDPRIDPANADTAQCFDWTAIDEAARHATTLKDAGQLITAPLVKVIATQKNLDRIPIHRKSVWHNLISDRTVEVRPLAPDWNAAAYQRHHQAIAGDGLLAISGGEGVEHSASLYVERGRTVLPLDIDLGAFFGDGSGGASRLYKTARARPERFVLQDGGLLQSKLQLVTVREADTDVRAADQARVIVEILEHHCIAYAFEVRLLNPGVPEFNDVENFFRNTVEATLKTMHYRWEEMGRSPTSEAFLNLEIFKKLHYADAVVADLTGLRQNNFFEAGYSLGRNIATIFTAKEGTDLPFDTKSIPVFFWKDEPELDRQRKFIEHWKLNFARPGLVTPRDL